MAILHAPDRGLLPAGPKLGFGWNIRCDVLIGCPNSTRSPLYRFGCGELQVADRLAGSKLALAGTAIGPADGLVLVSTH